MTSQRIAALERANTIRLRRAEFRRELKDGRAKMSERLREGIPDWLETIGAEKLLMCMPRVGVQAARSLLFEAGLGAATEGRRITDRQLAVLAVQFERIEALPSNVRRAAA